MLSTVSDLLGDTEKKLGNFPILMELTPNGANRQQSDVQS